MMRYTFFCLVLSSHSVFAQVDLNLGLMAYYPFSGNANDVSGNNNNPVFNNATLTVDRFGNPNNAYLFNGINNYIRIPNSTSLNQSNRISISTWVKVNGFYQGTCHGNNILMKGDDDNVAGKYLLRFDDYAYTNGQNCSSPIVDTLHQNFFGINTNNPPGGYTPHIQKDQWYNLVYTYDGSTAKLYVNCELKISTPANNLSFTNSYDLYFGKMVNPNYQYWFNGVLDEVRIYNRPLNEDEVNVLGGCLSSDTIINSYTSISAFNICNNTLTVEDASEFNAGDTVLLIQMKGAIIDSSNTAAFGTITDYKNAGNYELNYIKSKSGNDIELKNRIIRTYDIPTGKVQLIRVPYYQNSNFTSTLTCMPWDGNKGGVLVLNVQDSINLHANIDVSGRGFKGGQGYNPGDVALDCFRNNYTYPLTSNGNSGQKGESITSISQNIICGKGSPAGGGGGGLGHNSGGGGGGNGGSGGFGGYQLDNCGSFPFDNRGIGGKPLNYNSSANKIFMGSGGGAGEADNPGGFAPSGGNGGGIVILISDKIKTNTYSIKSNGNPGLTCNSSNCHDGMGGGGAGGAILVSTNQYLDTTLIQAVGGKGADMLSTTATSAGRVGPGGGGGGGIIYLKNSTVPTIIKTNVNGGLGGVLTQGANDPYGSTAGQNGLTLFNLNIPLSNSLFKFNIDSVRINDSATNCRSFDFKGLVYTNTYPIATWLWDFGDGTTSNLQNTSHIYAFDGNYMVTLIATDVNGCRDTVTKNIMTVAPVTPSISIIASSNPVCLGLPVTFTANSQNGGVSPIYQWLKNGIAVGTNSNSYIDMTLTNNDVIKCRLTTSISCALPITTESNSINMAVLTPPQAIRYPDVFANINQPIQLQAKNLGGNSYTWQPATGLNNQFISNPVFNYNVDQEYNILIATAEGCLVMDTLLVKIRGTKGIYVPKGFTPNGDGTNDRLYPILVGMDKLSYFRVYNRWGNLIFETNSDNPLSGWDGKFKGLLQPVETYTWIAEALDINGEKIKKSGKTVLVR